jgi:hypothetical protein
MNELSTIFMLMMNHTKTLTKRNFRIFVKDLYGPRKICLCKSSNYTNVRSIMRTSQILYSVLYFNVRFSTPFLSMSTKENLFLQINTRELFEKEEKKIAITIERRIVLLHWYKL